MSEEKTVQFQVLVDKVLEVKPHPKESVHSLEVVVVKGWEVITRKGTYYPGDKVIYIPINSTLSQWVENKLFSPDSKIKLEKRRVKAIRIQGFVSQGMICKPTELGLNPDGLEFEQDIKEALGIVKWEPPEESVPGLMSLPKSRNKPQENQYFHKYGGLDNFKHHPDLFEEGEQVSITEKIHGTHFRAGWVPFAANTLFRKVKQFLGLAPKYEFVFGSNNVQLQQRGETKTFYDENVYAKIVKQENLKEKLKFSEVIHGEIYGDSIQKNYSYGCAQGEHKLVVFDLRLQTKDSSEFVSRDDLRTFCSERGLVSVPELYCGPFSKEIAKGLTVGNSVLYPLQKVREGVVIKPLAETRCSIGRKVLKLISDAYLMGDNTDFH